MSGQGNASYLDTDSETGPPPPLRIPVSSRPSTTGRSTITGTESISVSSQQTRATGAPRFLNDRGISEAFTKRSSTNTFTPYLGAEKSFEVLPVVADSRNLVEVIDLSNIQYNRNAVGMKPKRKGFKSLWLALILIALGAGVAVGVLLGLSSDEANFCEQGDQNQRDLIAAEFDNAIAAAEFENSIFYDRIVIRCIPSDAFAALSQTQQTILERVDNIIFSFNLMEKVSNQAFDSSNLGSVTVVQFIGNNLFDLGDDVFAELPRLSTINLVGNLFRTLDSAVFRNSAATTILMGFNPLTEIPNALKDCIQLRDISLDFCAFLTNFEEQMFSNLNLNSLNFTSSALVNPSVNTEELGAALGVDPAVIIV